LIVGVIFMKKRDQTHLNNTGGCTFLGLALEQDVRGQPWQEEGRPKCSRNNLDVGGMS
jgi:hypothetical protein